MILKPEQVYERIQDNSGVYVVYIYYYLRDLTGVFHLGISDLKDIGFVSTEDYCCCKLDDNFEIDFGKYFSTLVFSQFRETVRDKNTVGFKKRHEAEYFLKLIDKYIRPFYTEAYGFLDELESESAINRMENKMIEYCSRNR